MSIPEFGTGAVKITPGHDPMDFDIGQTHGLPELTVIGLDGNMNEDAGAFAGLTQAEANRRIVDDPARAGPARLGASHTGTRSATAIAAARGSSR